MTILRMMVSPPAAFFLIGGLIWIYNIVNRKEGESLWMGAYESINLLGLMIQAIFIENFLANFLGMCTYLACSTKLKTANGLGVAVVFVLTVSGIKLVFINCDRAERARLAGFHRIRRRQSRLRILEFLLFISVIAAFVQILEIVIERFSPASQHAWILSPVNCC